MHYREVLRHCAQTLSDRGRQYGDSDECFTRISQIASAILDKPITPYDVAMILAAVKLGRMHGNRSYPDNYIDLANYSAFGAHFAEREEKSVANVVAMQKSPSPFAARLDAEKFASALNTVEEDVVEKGGDMSD